jgi:hypothetical protein
MRAMLFIGLPDSWHLQQLLKQGFGILQKCMTRSGKCLFEEGQKDDGKEPTEIRR